MASGDLIDWKAADDIAWHKALCLGRNHTFFWQRLQVELPGMGESVPVGVRGSFQLRSFFAAFCFATGVAMTLVLTRVHERRDTAWETAQLLNSTGVTGRSSSGLNRMHVSDQYTTATGSKQHGGKVSTSQRGHSGSSQSQASSDSSDSSSGSSGTASVSAGSVGANNASGESHRWSSKATPATSGRGSPTHSDSKRQQEISTTDIDTKAHPGATDRHARARHDNEGDSQPEVKIKDGSTEPSGESSKEGAGSHTDNPQRSHDHSQHHIDGSSDSKKDEGHGESDESSADRSAASSNKSVGGSSSKGGGRNSKRGASRGRRRAGSGRKRISRGPIQPALLQAIEAAADANSAVMLAVSLPVITCCG